MAQTDAFLDELRRISADLDRLMADRQTAGRLSQRQHDDHVDRAEKLAARLVRVGRGSGRLHNPPIAQVGAGYVW
jgi:hypothetical protein